MFISLSCCNWLIIQNQIFQKNSFLTLDLESSQVFYSHVFIASLAVTGIISTFFLSSLNVHHQTVFICYTCSTKIKWQFAWLPHILWRLGYGLGSHCSKTERQEKQTEQLCCHQSKLLLAQMHLCRMSF